MYNIGLFLAFSILGNVLFAQTPVVDAYVQQAFQRSEALKGKDLEIQKANAALLEARSYFLPEIRFGGTYTLAAGGRTIQFPIGDLLNPVYGTLNALTQTSNFPQVRNEEIQLLPNNFYDARFRISYPLNTKDLKANARIKSQLIEINAAARDAHMRTLAHDVQVAYSHQAQANEALAIYNRALLLLTENRRVAQSLFNNGVGLPSAVRRVEGEIARVEAAKSAATTQQRNAQAYFNFLLNQPYETAILPDSAWNSLPPTPIMNNPISAREELVQLSNAIAISEELTLLQARTALPKAGIQLDLGTQAFDFQWGGYALLGLSVDLPIWNNGRNDAKLQQTKIDTDINRLNRISTENAINIQAFTTQQTLLNLMEQYETFAIRVSSAESLHRDVLRRFKEGSANYIELLDAATQIDQLEIERSLLRLQAWQMYADWLRATATYPLNQN